MQTEEDEEDPESTGHTETSKKKQKKNSSVLQQLEDLKLKAKRLKAQRNKAEAEIEHLSKQLLSKAQEIESLKRMIAVEKAEKQALVDLMQQERWPSDRELEEEVDPLKEHFDKLNSLLAMKSTIFGGLTEPPKPPEETAEPTAATQQQEISIPSEQQEQPVVPNSEEVLELQGE